jgi:methionyl-tRNA synthetase
LSMIAKNLAGVMPQPGEATAADRDILDRADALLPLCRTAIEGQRIHEALNAIWAVVAETNRYFAAEEPWAVRKADPERFGTILWTTAEVLRQVAILAQPVMPNSMTRLLDLLAVPADARRFDQLGPAGRLAAGTALPVPVGIFPRHVEASAG